MKKLIHHYKASYTGLPGAAWILALVVFVNRSGSIVLFFLTLYLTKELQYSVAAAGQMISIYGIGSLCGAFLGGWLSDILGPKRVQLISLIFSGVGFIILGYVEAPYMISLLLFVVAMVHEAFRPANATAISQVCPLELRARGFALNRLAINVGVTIGPAIGGFLATYDYTILFWADGLTCIVASAILWRFFSQEEFERPVSAGHTEEIFRSPWKDGAILAFSLLTLLSGLMFVQLFNTWPLYLKEIYGLLENKIGLLVALNALMIVMIEMPLIHRLERRNPLRIIALGAVFMFAGFAILPFGRGWWYGAFTVMIWTIGEMLIFPLGSSFVANRASDKSRGKYMGMYIISFSLAFVCGPALGTWVYDYFGAKTLWVGSGVLGLFVMLGYLMLDLILRGSLKSPEQQPHKHEDSQSLP